MMAAIQGYESVARTLLRAGADADIRVKDGLTAADSAVKYCSMRTSPPASLQCAQRQTDYSLSAQCTAILGYDPRERGSGRNALTARRG